MGKLQGLLDIANGDEPLEIPVFIHHQEFFDAMLMQNLLGLLQCGSFRRLPVNSASMSW